MDAPRNPIWRGKIIGFWDSKWDNQKHVFIQCEAPKIAKLVYNSNKVVITIVTGAYKPTYILGPHIVANFRSDLHNQNIPLYQFSTPNATDRAGSIKCPTRGLFPCCIESVSMLTNQLPTVMIVQDMFEVTAPLELPHCCHFHTWAWCYVAYMGWGGGMLTFRWSAYGVDATLHTWGGEGGMLTFRWSAYGVLATLHTWGGGAC